MTGRLARVRVERGSSTLGDDRGYIEAKLIAGPPWSSGQVLARLAVESSTGEMAELAMELIESAIVVADERAAAADDGQVDEPAPEPLNSRRAGSVRLTTADGRRVCDLSAILVAGMAANGRPPEVIVWGTRVFTLAPGDRGRPRYVEGMAYVVAPSDTVTL